MQDIYIARAEGELALEEELYWWAFNAHSFRMKYSCRFGPACAWCRLCCCVPVASRVRRRAYVGVVRRFLTPDLPCSGVQGDYQYIQEALGKWSLHLFAAMLVCSEAAFLGCCQCA